MTGHERRVPAESPNTLRNSAAQSSLRASCIDVGGGVIVRDGCTRHHPLDGLLRVREAVPARCAVELDGFDLVAASDGSLELRPTGHHGSGSG